MAKNYTFNTIPELLSSLLSAYMLASVKAKAMPDKAKDIIKDALQPYLNMNNIGLFINDKNIGMLREKVIAGLPRLDKHYIIHAEPTADNKDVLWQVSYRPGGGTDALTMPHAKGYLGQLSQEQIFSIIEKFMNNAGTPAPLAKGNGTAE